MDEKQLHQIRITGMDNLLSLHAKGMTTREIAVES